MRPLFLSAFPVFLLLWVSALQADTPENVAVRQRSSFTIDTLHPVSYPAGFRNERTGQDSTPVADSDQPRPTQRTPIGIIVAFHIGFKPPFNQAPILGNNFGFTAGYWLFPQIVLLGYIGTSVLLDYSPPGSGIYMEATSQTIALECRLSPPPLKNLYLAAGLGHLRIRADTLRDTKSTGSSVLPGFSQSMMNTSVGAGVAFQGFIFEARSNFGAEKVQVTPERSTQVRNLEIRVGVNLEL